MSYTPKQKYYNNVSPWLDDLRQWQPRPAVTGEQHTDVVVIGSGIAGTATASAFLEETDQKVLIIEADVVASGASGRNAGQAVAMLELHYEKLIDQHGIEAVQELVQFLERGWMHLEALCDRLNISYETVEGLDGLMTQKDLADAISTQDIRTQLGYAPDPILVSPENMPTDRNEEWIVVTSQKDIQKKMKVRSQDCLGIATQRRTVLNAAEVCRALVIEMEQRYADRFQLAERSPVTAVMCDDDGVRVITERGLVHTKQVIFCTNAYAMPATTRGTRAVRLPTVEPKMGYMVGMLDPAHAQTSAISYAHERALDPEVDSTSYFYLTRRPTKRGDMVTIGGLDYALRPHEKYASSDPVESEIVEKYQEWINEHRPELSDEPITYQWHGLMGYTPNGMRVLGRHPDESRIFFNVGCNGIGLLQSVMSAHALVGEWKNEKNAIPQLFRFS